MKKEALPHTLFAKCNMVSAGAFSLLGRKNRRNRCCTDSEEKKETDAHFLHFFFSSIHFKFLVPWTLQNGDKKTALREMEILSFKSERGNFFSANIIIKQKPLKSGVEM